MTGDSAKFQTLMTKGHNAAWELKWESAAQYYDEALKEVPDHPMALSSLGLAYFQLNQYDEALKLYQRFSVLNPSDPMPFEKSARIYERVGMLDEATQSFMQGAEMQLRLHDVDRAIEDFKNAIHLKPDNLTVHTRLAMVFDKMGRKDDAVSEYLYTAALMEENGEYQKAQQVVQYTLGLSPNNTSALKAMELIKERKSLADFSQANQEERYASAIQVEPVKEKEEVEEPQPLYDPVTETRLKALKQMAGYLFEQNEENPSGDSGNKQAIDSLTRNPEGLTPEQAERARVQLHLSQAIDYQTSGQDELAAVELESAVELGLQQPAVFYVLGLIMRAKSPDKALKYLERSVKNPDYELASYLLIADTLYGLAQYKEASAAALKALKVADSESVPPEQAQELAQLYEPIFESQTHVTKEDDLQYLYQVINKQLERPDWRDYLKAARKQLPLQPEGSPPLPLAELLLETSNSQVVESLGTIRRLTSEGKYRTAMEEAYRAITFAPTYLPLHIQMGELLITEGRLMEAVEKFLLVSNLYNLRGDTSQAVHLLERVSRMAPMDMKVRNTLIDLYKASGRVDDALAQFMDLANTYYLLADLETARKTYDQALALSKQSSTPRQWVVKILGKMADLEVQSLDFKSAVRIFEQIRSLQPQDISPRATLIDLHLRTGQLNAAAIEMEDYLKLLEGARQYAKAAQFLDELLKDRPENQSLQKRMVQFYVQHEQRKIAVEKLDGLAERLLGEGNKEASLAAIQSIIDLAPANVVDYNQLYTQLKASI